MNSTGEWEKDFKALYERVKRDVEQGERSLEKLFSDEDRAFLGTIGSKPIEMFDAADDAVRYGEPSYEDMLEIHRMRLEYFIKVQHGVFPAPVNEYRAKTAELGGIPWLPRAIDKVRAKLRGQLVDDFFYPCGGDRQFLEKIRMSPPDFFRLVRDSSSDEEILRKVKKQG